MAYHKRLLSQIQHRIRVHLLQRAGVKLTGRVKIAGYKPQVRNEGSITFGRDVVLRGTFAPVCLTSRSTGEIRVGDKVLLNTGVKLYAADKVIIGDNCLIGNDSVLCDANFHSVHQRSRETIRPIMLGKNVWIGRNVIVLPGVTIGNHSVIAAGSVVYEDVPEKQLWRGNPACYVKDIDADDDFIRR